MAKSRRSSSDSHRDKSPARDEPPRAHEAQISRVAQNSEDSELFRAAVRNVKPLAPATQAQAPGNVRKLAPARARAAAREAARDMPLLAEEVSAEDAVSGTEALSFRRPGVRTQTLRHLRRGLYPVEDAIDLHGMSQAAARDSLAEFLEQSRLSGYRCVRIVHGKGYRSGARGPVLKIAVNAWLKRHADVMAFTSARGIDGGTGAVYALLRA